MCKIDDKLVEQWKSMPRNEEASDFYDEKIFSGRQRCIH